MIESLLENLPNAVHDKVDLPDSEGAATYSESSFLEALPVIHHIVRRRRMFFQQADVLDLAQGIALRLWKWRDKNGEKSDSMSNEEWNAYAARTAYNEVNRHLSKSARTSVSLDGAEHIAESSVEGDTETEVYSLIRSVWQEICGLSRRQRRALLLHSQELVVYFLQSGIKNEELARVLGFDETEWNDIRNRIPLSDVQIAEVTKEQDETRSLPAIARSVKKARHDARKKLEGVGSK